jgi:hypothetical protein
MNLDNKRMLGMCEKLEQLGDITWRGFMVTAKFDEELAGACKSSGCYEVASGIEAGSPQQFLEILESLPPEKSMRVLLEWQKRLGSA